MSMLARNLLILRRDNPGSAVAVDPNHSIEILLSIYFRNGMEADPRHPNLVMQDEMGLE
jgi:hypothetical protein